MVVDCINELVRLTAFPNKKKAEFLYEPQKIGRQNQIFVVILGGRKSGSTEIIVRGLIQTRYF